MPIIALDFQIFFRFLLPLEIALDGWSLLETLSLCHAESSLGNASLQLAIQKNVPCSLPDIVDSSCVCLVCIVGPIVLSQRMPQAVLFLLAWFLNCSESPH